jgi:hypothetical protein
MDLCAKFQLSRCFTGREIGHRRTDGQTDRRTDGRHDDFSKAHFLKMCSKYVFRNNHGYGKVFSLQMRKKSTFQERFQKNPPEVTPILCMESNLHYVKKLCAKGEK